jgi:hypothetical protein
LPFAPSTVITGDGASHTITLQFKESGGSTATIANLSATNTPTMSFSLCPSN